LKAHAQLACLYGCITTCIAITLLSNTCAGISYSRVAHIFSQIANAVQENININGVFVPPGIVKGRAIRASADNVDKKVDTHDGKNSFHGMAASIYQPTCNGKPLVEPLDLCEVSPGALVGIPSTCIKLMPCKITGSPKPNISPSYSSYKIGCHEKHFENALNNDTAWMMARYFNRSPQPSPSPDMPEQIIERATVPTETAACRDSTVLPDPACCLAPGTSDAQTTIPEDSTSTSTDHRVRQMETQSVPGPADVRQQVPVWSANNSLLNSPTASKESPVIIDKAYAFPISMPQAMSGLTELPHWINYASSTIWFQVVTKNLWSHLTWTFTSES
jgi:hypothetical protein